MTPSDISCVRISAAWSVVPSDAVSHTMTEPYNAGLAANQLIENCSAVFCVDNEVTEYNTGDQGADSVFV